MNDFIFFLICNLIGGTALVGLFLYQWSDHKKAESYWKGYDLGLMVAKEDLAHWADKAHEKGRIQGQEEVIAWTWAMYPVVSDRYTWSEWHEMVRRHLEA